MSNNDNTPPKKSLSAALADITEAAQEINDNVVGPIKVKAKNTARVIAQREAVKAARNHHVEALTVGRNVWWRGEQMRLSQEARHELEFHLRRMWAITFLANMKSHGFNWEGIRKLTGKTRQTWNNVTHSGFVPLHILKLPSDSEERREYMDEESYRPVTNSFIRKVTEETQKAKYTIHTHAFVYACSHGMTVWENDFLELEGDDQFVIGRLGDDGVNYFNDAKSDGSVVCAAIMGPNGETKPLEVFPLLGIDAREINDHFAHEETINVELVAHGFNDETKEPNPKAKIALEEWRSEQRAMADHWSEPVPTDPNEFRPPRPSTPKPEQPTPTLGSKSEDQSQSIIKKDDGTPPNADIGGFYIFNRPIELLPQMADENGQIKLTVLVQMDDDGKKPKGVVATDNKGWFHWS